MAKRSKVTVGGTGDHQTPEDGAVEATIARMERREAMVRGDKAVRRVEPGYDGGRRLVADSVVSPYDPKRRETVTRNSRHDPVEQLYQQRDRNGRRLIDESERLAGIEIRTMVEALGLDAVRSIALDERVDGGGHYYDIGARRYEAGRRVRALKASIGAEYFEIVMRIAGYGEPVTCVAIDFEREDATDEEAMVNGACSARMRDRIGWAFRRALKHAAVHLGYRPPPRQGRIAGWAAEDARPTL